MNLLLIEDEDWFIKSVQQASNATEDVKLLVPDTCNLKNLQFDESRPLEDQLIDQLHDIVEKHAIDLVLLDTDLSRAQQELRTQVEYRQAFQTLGIPVCRYKKGQSKTKLATLDDLQKIARDGSSAIWVPKSLLDDTNALVEWLRHVGAGFEKLSSALKENPDLLKSRLGPSGILADLLGRDYLKSDFLGYTAQNSFFFSSGSSSDLSFDLERLYATQLGYWLYNFILAFPGPILSSNATCAFLNLEQESFDLREVQELVASCKYSGPFDGLGYYWHRDLDEMVNSHGGDIAQASALAGLQLKRIDAESKSGLAYFCVLDMVPIKASDAASTNPDWIPPGAFLSRIKAAELDELGPMLKI